MKKKKSIQGVCIAVKQAASETIPSINMCHDETTMPHYVAKLGTRCSYIGSQRADAIVSTVKASTAEWECLSIDSRLCKHALASSASINMSGGSSVSMDDDVSLPEHVCAQSMVESLTSEGSLSSANKCLGKIFSFRNFDILNHRK